MGAVKNLKPVEALGDHLELLYGTETGFVYCPTKSLTLEGKSDDDGLWTPHWFRWPEQRETLVRHIESSRKEYDVYIGVALYLEPGKAEPEFIKGTFNFHVDFDGKVPTAARLAELNIPFPSGRICSSTEGHEHWYWRSPTLITELDVIQDINRTLVYALDGDIGGWSSAKVLRPVSAINHKRNNEEVTIISIDKTRFNPPASFEKVARPRASFSKEDFDTSLIPNFLHVVAKYQITNPDFLDLLGKGKLPEEQKRSETLARVGHHCAEHGMSSMEIFSILAWKDNTWGKYRDRADGEKRLIELVNYVQGKHISATGEEEKPPDAEYMLKTYGYKTFNRKVDKTKYLIQGLLPETGLLYLAGPSGTGKTLLTLDSGRELVLGRSKFGWKCELDEQLRLLHISLEMPEGELREFTEPAEPESEEELEILEKNFHIYAEPEIIRFYQRESTPVIKLVRFIEWYKPHLITLDSATVGLAKDLLNSSDVQESLNFLAWLRSKFKCAMWIIAHTRKDPPRHGYKEKDLDDLFGVQNIAASASSVIAIQKVDKEKDPDNKDLIVNISYLKTRFQASSEMFQAKLDPTSLSFVRPTLTTPYVPIQPITTPPVAKPKDDPGDFIQV